MEYTGVIHPQLGLKANIEATTSLPREISVIFEDPKHGKVVCVEDETHEIPKDLVKRISKKVKEKRGRVPMKTVSGVLPYSGIIRRFNKPSLSISVSGIKRLILRFVNVILASFRVIFEQFQPQPEKANLNSVRVGISF